MQIDEQELWARLGKQAVELELLRAEIARLTAELEKRVKEQDGKS